MAIQLIQNNNITFDIRPYLIDRGWNLNSPSKVTHNSENEGDLELLSYGVVTGETYEYSFTLTDVTSGGVRVTIGGASSGYIATSGYHQGSLTAIDSSNVKIYSDGDLELSDFNISLESNSESTDGKTDTITWSEQRKRWVTFKDIIPESGFSMYTNMFTLKDGNLWEHKVEGTVPNNFYGVQYSSRVKFPVSSVGVKTYHSIAVHANKVLGTTEEGITTQLGNVTDLITYDFTTSADGVHYANKLRDALLDEKLKGRYIVVELTDEETKDQKLQLFKVVIKSDISSPNE